MNVLSAIGQALDFIWKGAVAYAKTPEGEKELNDVIAALESSDQPESSQSSSGETSAEMVNSLELRRARANRQ